MQSFLHKTVILADGDYPSADRAQQALATARHVVCCDRAAVRLVRRTGRIPDAIVGDLDSLPAAFRKRHAAIAVHVAEQDDNDLAKAFCFCIGRGWRDIVILGATGKREDHTLGNISWLADFAAEAPEVAMLTNHGIFTVLQAPGGTIATEPGMQISFFGFDRNQRITATGVVFPVRDLPLRRWNTATLNEATGRRVTLSFSGEPVIVFRNAAK